MATMHLAAAAANSPDSTKFIVIGVSALLTVILGLRFAVAWRQNRRLAERMGGFTPTESQLANVHATILVGVLIGCMALAVAAVLSDNVRDALSELGEHSRLIPTGLTPVVLLYAAWVRRRIRRAVTERAELGR
jgi:hypothetical protein